MELCMPSVGRRPKRAHLNTDPMQCCHHRGRTPVGLAECLTRLAIPVDPLWVPACFPNTAIADRSRFAQRCGSRPYTGPVSLARRRVASFGPRFVGNSESAGGGPTDHRDFEFLLPHSMD